MSATAASPGTPFRTLAAALCNGGAANTTVGVVAGTNVASCDRTPNIGTGSFDLTFAIAVPTNKVIVDVTPAHLAGGHNLNYSATWDVTGQILTVAFASDANLATDPPHFGVDLLRCEA